MAIVLNVSFSWNYGTVKQKDEQVKFSKLHSNQTRTRPPKKKFYLWAEHKLWAKRTGLAGRLAGMEPWQCNLALVKTKIFLKLNS